MDETKGDVPLSVFVSYSHQDEKHRERLETHLSLLLRDGRITLSHDRRIRAGEHWEERISDYLETADVVLLLVSADFLASDYAYEIEVRRALERHGDGAARVVPIVVKPCDWQGAPFGRLQALPRDGRPVTSWDDPEDAWTQVARELRALVEERRQQNAGSPPPDPEPRFPNDRIRAWSRTLKDAYRRQEQLIAAGRNTQDADEEIDDLRRRLREGGLQSGDLLYRGRFQLIEEIGSGGFATVWRAFDRRRRTPVAVKVLHSQYARDASRRDRFFRGAREMASLHHPGIVRVIEEQGRDGRLHFFVMELVDDGDLQRAVNDGRLPDVRERLRLVLDVGEALAFAHQRGVIHRDVKPANVLLDAAGRARLTDFDLVRAVDSSAGTRTGSMLGTFVYAAPEVLHNAKEADVKADVYGADRARASGTRASRTGIGVSACCSRRILPPEALELSPFQPNLASRTEEDGRPGKRSSDLRLELHRQQQVVLDEYPVHRAKGNAADRAVPREETIERIACPVECESFPHEPQERDLVDDEAFVLKQGVGELRQLRLDATDL
jgi:hypothetical protein